MVLKRPLKKILRKSQTNWNKFLKPALNLAGPFIGMPVSAETKNPRIGQATANILGNLSGGEILSLTDIYGNGLGLKIM